MRHFKFPAGVFEVHRQVSVPENTIIEGVANPNGQDKTQKPDYQGQTVFVATSGVSDGNACYCQNLERSWEPLSPRNPYHCQHLTNKEVRSLRPGFLMYSNTVVKNIAYQGKDTLRPSDNGALCGGGVFETPGCVHNQCDLVARDLFRQFIYIYILLNLRESEISTTVRTNCLSFVSDLSLSLSLLQSDLSTTAIQIYIGNCLWHPGLFPHLMTGNGKPVTNVHIENVRMNDYSDNPILASQLAVWVAQTTHDQPTSQVTVKNLVAMFLHADGINFHGFVQNALVDDCYIQNTGDDIYAVWGSHFDTRNIVFQNSVGVDAGRARQNHYGSCVAVYGAKEATFRDLTCYAPEQNTHDCYDRKNNGETCNGCLGIIKESFDADYRGSVFTFTGCEFYRLRRHEENGRQVYDLSNPQRTGRPLVCNNEWKRGGLVVSVN